jgi:hypothetical protein
MNEIVRYEAPSSSSRASDTLAIMGEAAELAAKLARTQEFVPKGLQNRPEAILATILKGNELGIPPMAALAGIHVVQGRPGLSAELMRALVSSAGHEIGFEEMSDTYVTAYGRRKDTGQELRITWHIDQAKRAGLANKDVWRAYPRNMLAARATTDLCRFMFADVIGGMRSVEELMDIPPEELDVLEPGGPGVPAAELEAGEAPAGEPATRKATDGGTAAKKAPAKKAAAKKAAAPAAAAPRVDPPALPGDEPAPPAKLEAVPDPDDEVIDAEVVEEADDPAVLERAKRIAMKAAELELDRADVIYAVTAGRQTSGKALTEAEAIDVLEALRKIRAGVMILDTSGAEPELVDAVPTGKHTEEPTAPAPAADDDDHTRWTEERWREFIAEHGVKVVAFVKKAHELAEHTGEKPMDEFGHIVGKVSLTMLMREWVLEQSGAS